MRAIWVVDDDQSIRWVLEKAISRQGFACRAFENVRDVLHALDSEAPAVLISDIRMPGKTGLELLQHVRERLPGLPVIIMTAYSDLESAVSAFQGGAFEYLPKPFDVNKAIELIQRAISEAPKEPVPEETADELPEILGHAPSMQDVFRAIGRLSQSNVTVLITGESGSGKELVARALHRHSPRAAQPFIALNTAAIPKDLLESELFGHERGSFTGAAQQRRGRFEQAENGTLFLDEIGDMPSELQTRLLRVLSDGHYYRVGGHQPIKANVRVIAATHQNLDERVRQGLFREDLYHRLNVIRLRLPPLRERREDIPLLTRHFLTVSARDLGVDSKRLSEPVVHALMQLPFPGNVRQLENLCRWLTVMAPSQIVQLHDLPPEVIETLSASGFTGQAGQGMQTAMAMAPVSLQAAVAPLGSTPGFAPGFPSAANGGSPSAPVSSDAVVRGAVPGMSSPVTASVHGVDAVIATEGSGPRSGPGASPTAAFGSVDRAQSSEWPNPVIPAARSFPMAGSVIQRFGEVYPTAQPPVNARSNGVTDPFGDSHPTSPVHHAPSTDSNVQTDAAAQAGSVSDWLSQLDRVAEKCLESGESEVMDRLAAQFETTVIRAALRHTHGRRIEAAQRLGIGRNTITRKIQELNIPTEDLD